MFDLSHLGWNAELADAWSAQSAEGTLVPGRIAAEHRGAYDVLTEGGELRATLSGRLSYVLSRAELPAVGDWVGLAPRPGERAGTIGKVLPRRTALVRRAPERPTRSQVLAANVDVVLVVTSANRNLRASRVERMLALARESGAQGVVVLSKVDLCDDLPARVGEVRAAAGSHPVVALSGLTGAGVSELAAHLLPGRTLVLLGSSGVGKSTLANRLLGREAQATAEIRSDDKGRHATTHRQLLVLPGGGVLIDTPGLREVGLWDDEGGGLESAFPDVEALVARCRFGDCAHGDEPGCAIQEALADGTLEPSRLRSWHKLARELEHVRARRDAGARHERRQRMKKFAKHVRRLPNKRSDR